MTKDAAPSVEELADGIEVDLRRAADPERKRVTSGYFPTKLEIVGVGAPVMHKLAREAVTRLRGEPPKTVLRLSSRLVKGGTHEGRQVGYAILERRKDVLALLGRTELERLGKGNDNWASVDAFSTFVAGQVWRMGGIGDETVVAWAASPDLWWRRTALVCTVPLNMKSRGGEGDPARTFRICELLVEDREPMVAKGLSWALRAVIQHDREGVADFLARHDEALPALVRREVRNKLETGLKVPKG